MKKGIIRFALVATLAAICSVASAQDRQAKTDEFNGHWFIGVYGGIGQTVGETSFGNLISPAAGFNFGYRFTPVWSLRAGIGGWQGKGALLAPTREYKFNYLQGSVDVMVDICSIFSGYRMSRALTPYLFAGAGVNGSFNNDEAQAFKSSFPSDNLLWDGSKVFPVGRFGIGTGIRISDAVQFNVEVNGNFLSDRFNSKRGSAVDWQLGAQAGFTFNIGLKKNRKSSAASQPYVAPAPAPAQEPAPKPEPEPQPQPQPEKQVEEPAPAPQPAPVVEEYLDNVYFLIGKYEIRESEAAKIRTIASRLKEAPTAKVSLTGYADAQTGTPERNYYLSQKRAEAVAAALEEAGITKDRIKVAYKGSTEAPYDKPEENRVVICIVSE